MSFGHGDIESIVSGMKNGGWDALEGTNEEVRKRLELDKARSEEEARAIASAWASFAETPGGKKAIQALLNSTLNRTVFFVNLQLPPDQTAIWGAFREGQNAVATEIVRQIAKGRGDDLPPSTRETP